MKLFTSSLCAGLLLSSAVGISALIGSATWEFMALSAFSVVPLSLIAGIVSLIIASIAGWTAQALDRRRRLPRWIGPRFILSIAAFGSLAIISQAVHAATPRQRYEQMVGVAGDHASGIQVAGFDSFLARRWLLSFQFPPDQIPAMVTRWELKEVDPISLRDRLRSDAALGASDSPLIRDAPGSEGIRCYEWHRGGAAGSGEWITLVSRDADQKVWFYRGYQN